MSTLGGWKVNVQVGKMPQQVATAFGEIMGNLVGAKYTPIAYLGSQLVNGTNHAILAEQLVVTGVDTKNIVCVILNEKPGSVAGKDFALVNINKVLDGGVQFGGVKIDVMTDMTDEVKAVFNEAFEGFVGSRIEPFALLSTSSSPRLPPLSKTPRPPLSSSQSTALPAISNSKKSSDFKLQAILQERASPWSTFLFFIA